MANLPRFCPSSHEEQFISKTQLIPYTASPSTNKASLRLSPAFDAPTPAKYNNRNIDNSSLNIHVIIGNRRLKRTLDLRYDKARNIIHIPSQTVSLKSSKRNNCKIPTPIPPSTLRQEVNPLRNTVTNHS